MDINQSSLSQSKLKKPGITCSVVENRTIAEANKGKAVQGTQMQTGYIPLELKEGQVVKGQILDHRYNEVRIQIEPGKQIINANLSGDIPLTIGQNARFTVAEDSSDRLVLKYLPENTSASESAVEKALTASGLPMSDRNREIVNELLNHTLPVDKHTLQTLIRLSNRNMGASPLTLVLMMKNNIPMTSSNIQQFEAYQKGSGQLLKDIQAITKDLTQLLLTQDEAVPEHTSLGLGRATATDEFNMQTNKIPSPAITINKQLMDLIISGSNTSDRSAIPLNEVFRSEDLQRLLDTLTQKAKEQPIMAENMEPDSIFHRLDQLKEGTLSLGEARKLVASFYPEAEQPLLLNQAVTQKTFTALQNPPFPDIILSFIEQYSKTVDHSGDITTQMPGNELAAFKELLLETPFLSPIAEQIDRTAVSAPEVFRLIHEHLTGADDKTILTLLSSPPYQRLLKQAFHDRWTITPEKLSKQAAVKELYDHLLEDMDKINTILQQDKPQVTEESLREPVKNLQENLRFMSDLNEMFTYLQLPVQLQKQDIHSELYVYTRKKALQTGKNLSVLLHLEMSNLGSMNIQIQMDHNVIHTKFYMEEETAKELVSENISFLSEALTKKGYHLQYEVNTSYEKPDFSKDFIEGGISEGEAKRYTFDIRT